MACMLRHCGRAVWGRKLDALVLRRIVRSRKIDRAIGFGFDHCVGYSGCWCGLCDHQRRDTITGQDIGGNRAESFAEEARIAADDYPSSIRFLRRHVARDAVYRPMNIGGGKFFGHHGSPSGSAKPHLRWHHLPLMLCPTVVA